MAKQVKMLLLGQLKDVADPKDALCEFMRDCADILILLLGAGESGKSTVLKQMKLLYASGFSTAERKSYRRIIFSNILNSLREILESMVIYQISFEREENKVLVLGHHSPVFPINELWCSPRANKC